MSNSCWQLAIGQAGIVVRSRERFDSGSKGAKPTTVQWYIANFPQQENTKEGRCESKKNKLTS